VYVTNIPDSLTGDTSGKQIGFIAYLPSEQAWRPVNASNFYFIQCIGVFVKDVRNKEKALNVNQFRAFL
jgi:hypothetical protein